jgi:UrcA family protein
VRHPDRIDPAQRDEQEIALNPFIFRAAPTAAILALAVLAPSLGFAADAFPRAPEVAVRDVFFADLNLQNVAGITRLHARIADAAIEVCGGDDRTNLAQLRRREQCRADAIVRAVAAVKSPLLTQHHESRVRLAAL